MKPVALVSTALLAAGSSLGQDAYTDNWMIAIAIVSKEPPTTHHFDRNDRAQLKVQCIRGNLLISVGWNSSLSGRDEPTEEMWFDDEPDESDPQWSHDTGRDESFYQGNARRLLSRLLDTREFRVKYGKGFYDEEVGATFDLLGIRDAVRPIYTFCDLGEPKTDDAS